MTDAERLALIKARYEQFRRGGVDEAIVFANQAQNDMPYLLGLAEKLAVVTAERDRLLRIVEILADPEEYREPQFCIPVSLRSMAQQALAQKG